ncbi:MAG: ATP-dependent DNA helicase [Bacteroidetes bacterium GWF2_29_10]|nr:MAG: ATP-dependent DNA helicase [Bacteroidetes bacterium GWF2_29_10]
MSYLDLLNDAQRSAVIHNEGAVMVIAGAGSGKTRVLTYKIAHLLNNKVDAFNILALTFTNKAAKEMKDRIQKIVTGNESLNISMGTFHSVFAKILRVESTKLGYPTNFTIYDMADSKSLIKHIIKEQDLDDKIYSPNSVLSRISSLKTNLISPAEYNSSDDYLNEDKRAQRPKFGLLYSLYCERCFKSSAMDFDDLLYKTNVLFRDYPDILNKYQKKYKYILVDEYQDTNFSQYLIVRKLAQLHKNICVVGDDAQSIYSFRGANIQNILNFKKDYPTFKMFKLEQNYRSSKTIVEAANSVIEKNTEQIKKNVWTDNEIGKNINVVETINDIDEANYIADIIKNTIFTTDDDYNKIAVFYRTNSQSRQLEESFRKKGIPYKIYGGMSFYQRKEIKDLMAYFRLTINNNDEEAFLRVINYPARGIGKTTIDRLVLAARTNNTDIWTIMENPNLFPSDINNATKTRLKDFAVKIKGFTASLLQKNAYELASYITSNTGIMKELFDDRTPEGITRYENVEELLNGIKEFADSYYVEEVVDPEALFPSLDKYVNEISLITEIKDENSDKNTVSLMTLHAAKGLEFPYVFICGVEENLFPSQLSLQSRKEIEEERRLFYVGITRAEKELIITYTNQRYQWGQLRPAEQSRFIKEIDHKYVDFVSTSEHYSYNNDFSKNKFSDNRDDYNNNDWDISEFQDKTHYYKKIQKQTTIATNSPAFAQNKKMVKLEEVINTPSFNDTGNNDWDEGDKVFHQRFGNGSILNIEGVGQNKKASVLFDNFGKKDLILKFAKLTKLNN